MNCHELRPDITALADDNLESQLASGVQEHLASCSLCTQFYYQQLQLTQWFKTGEVQLDPPTEIWRTIETRIERERKPSWSVLDLFQVPSLRYAWAGSTFLILFSLFSVTLLRTDGQIDARQQILADLKSYTVETQGNPFWPPVKRQNPFVDFNRGEDPHSHLVKDSK